MKGNRGFSFIELLMVTAIIAILAGLAVPHIQRVRMSAQEKTALATVRVFFEAQALHHTRFQTYGTLAQLVSNEFIDDSLISGDKGGYQYAVGGITTSHYEVTAIPLVFDVSGRAGFYVDETGVIRTTMNGSAPNASSPPYQ